MPTSKGLMAPSIVYSDAAQGETFLPGQIFVFGGFILRANSLGHLKQVDSSIGSIPSEYSGSTRRRFSMTREVIVGLRAEQAVMVKPPSRSLFPDNVVHSNTSTSVGVKTSGSRVRGPELCV